MLAIPPEPRSLPPACGEVRFRRSEPEGRLRAILDYWRRRRGGRRWPRRADIDPLDIPELLPAVVLLDVVGAPPRFRRRLIGSAVVEGEGGDATGRWLDEGLTPPLAAAVVRQHREAVEAPEGCCYTAEFTGPDGRRHRWQRLLLPLSCDGRHVDMLFGGFRYPRPRDGEPR